VKWFLSKLPFFVQYELRRLKYFVKILFGEFKSDEPDFEALGQYVSQGDWVIDIGANVGHYTVRLANLVGPRGRVFAFEPVPTTFSLLSANVIRSKCNNVSLLNAAASSNSTLVNMEVPCFESGIANYYRASINSNKSGGQGFSVFTLPIDCFNLSNKINFIKIDAEGHEPEVLSGLWGLIEKDLPTLLIETVDEETKSRLLKLGYSEDSLEGSPNKIFTH
jgi:FkbM family methyltransferase